MTTYGPFPGETMVTKRKLDLDRFVKELALERGQPIDRRTGHGWCGSTRPAFPMYPTDVVLGLYTWMLRSAQKHKVERDGFSAFGQIASTRGALGIYEADRLTRNWRRQMSDRITRALVDHWCLLEEWRSKVNLEPLPKALWVHGLFHQNVSHSMLDDELDALFGLMGRRTRVSFNRYHKDAIWIVRVWLKPSPTAWSAGMAYGIDGSVWDADPRTTPWIGSNPLVPVQRPDESLVTFVRRARRTFEKWLLPPETTACSSGTVCAGKPGVGDYEITCPVY